MSHRVYLSSSNLPRMPEGSRNEWRGFFGSGGELEANAFFPLFWRALFSENDIRRARFIDEYDVDDEAASVDREECLEDFGPDATYPYLATDKASALARLASRREQIMAVIGEHYRPIYTAFAAMIARDFGGHILLRTIGLPDAADAEPWLRTDLALLEKLTDRNALDDLAKDLARHDADPVWLLAGNGTSSTSPWPTPELKALFSQPHKQDKQGKPPRPLTPKQIEKLDREQAAKRNQKPAGWLDSALEWLAALAAAGAALGAYGFTQSVWLAVLAFLAVALGLAFALIKLRGPRF